MIIESLLLTIMLVVFGIVLFALIVAKALGKTMACVFPFGLACPKPTTPVEPVEYFEQEVESACTKDRCSTRIE